jgi:hypothetical protein
MVEYMRECVARTKSSTVVCQREKKRLHDVSDFMIDNINNTAIFSKYESNNSRKCKYV